MTEDEQKAAEAAEGKAPVASAGDQPGTNGGGQDTPAPAQNTPPASGDIFAQAAAGLDDWTAEMNVPKQQTNAKAEPDPNVEKLLTRDEAPDTSAPTTDGPPEDGGSSRPSNKRWRFAKRIVGFINPIMGYILAWLNMDIGREEDYEADNKDQTVLQEAWYDALEQWQVEGDERAGLAMAYGEVHGPDAAIGILARLRNWMNRPKQPPRTATIPPRPAAPMPDTDLGQGVPDNTDYKRLCKFPGCNKELDSDDVSFCGPSHAAQYASKSRKEPAQHPPYTTFEKRQWPNGTIKIVEIRPAK